MSHVIFLIRLNFLLLVSICGSLLLGVLSFLVPYNVFVYLCRYLAKLMLICCGISVEVERKSEVVSTNLTRGYMLNNCILVANHISWLDLLLLPTVHWVVFISRIEVKKWPIIGWFITRCGTIYLNRSSKKELLNINKTTANYLKRGRAIGFFPEGRTTAGDTVTNFKSPLFEAAINMSSMIIPIVIAYYHANGSRAQEVTYCDVNLWQSVKATLMLAKVKAKIMVLPPIDAKRFQTRDALCAYVHDIIKTNYGIIKDHYSHNSFILGKSPPTQEL